MDTLVRRVLDHWVARSFGAGLVATVVDVAVLLVAVRLGLAPVPAAAVGVIVGSVVSFALNKYVAFRDGSSPLLPQIGKYAATLAVAATVHSGLMWLLLERIHAPVLVAKLLVDLLVFGVGNLWAMRCLVFRVPGADPS